MSVKEVINRVQGAGEKPNFLSEVIDTDDYREAKCIELFAESGLDVLTEELEAYVKDLGYEMHRPLTSRYIGQPEGFFTLFWVEEHGSGNGKIIKVTPSLVTEEIIFEGREELALGKVDWEKRENVEAALAYTFLNPREQIAPSYEGSRVRSRRYGATI